MKFVGDIYLERDTSVRPVISMEFFPPKTDEGERVFLEKTLPVLARLKPEYCSVTYGAGGTTAAKTLMITDRIQREHGLVAVHHLTCVNFTRAQIGELLDRAAEMNIRNILALRGDPPGGKGEFVKTEGGFEFSRELVAYIRGRYGFSVGVAGFPEGHIACKEGRFADWLRLKQKIDAGASFVITQLFYDNAYFYEFYEHMTKNLRVTIPIVPGIMPIMSRAQIKRITELCGAKWPPALLSKLEALGDDDAAVTELGIEYATKQCEDLLKFGVPGLHFCTMNKVYPTQQILKNLNLAQ